MEDQSYYIGTELKLATTINCEGFDMDTDTWVATIRRGTNTITCSRGNNSVFSEGQWYILVDTLQLGAGTAYIIMEIDVPDDDFEDGFRHEVLKKKLCNIVAV